MNKNRNLTITAVLIALALAATIWYSFFSRVAPPDFSQYPAGTERKTAFFSYFAPIVAELNNDILSERQTVIAACDKGGSPANALASLAEQYRVDGSELSDEAFCNEMLRRVDIIPASLALAQGANESAWGTSRFAQQGNNFFGQWCFSKGCGIVPNDRDSGKNHEVADFRSPSDSVESYMLNINRHDAYKPLRKIRASLRDADKAITGLQLSWGLNNYSERREAYGEELREMISYNELTEYDSDAI